MAMNAAETECGVCHEEFDEEARCPRIFPCIHTLCTSCIDQLILNNVSQCPFCRKHFMAKCSRDVMKNHTLIELMQYKILQEINSKSASVDQVPPRKKLIENMKKETRETTCLYLANCQETEKQIEKTLQEVMNLEKKVKEENMRIVNDVVPKIRNVIFQNNRMIDELDRTKNKLKNNLKEVKGNDKQLQKMKGNLDSCTAETLCKSAALLDEVVETNTVIGSWIQNFKGIISKEEETLHATEEVIERIREKINIIFEVLNSKGEKEKEKEEETAPTSVMADMAIQENNLPTQITPATLQEMNDQVKCLVNEGRIYAIQHQKVGRRRSGRISYSEDEKLCLHHLRDEPLPSNVHVVDHEDVMKLVKPSPRLVFLEMSDGQSTLGRLYIRLHPHTKGAKQFVLLCTGEKGPSYANTNIFGVWNKGNVDEYVRGGDYERNNGKGGKALVSRMWMEKGGEYEKPWLSGSVEGRSENWWLGNATAAQFVINTRDNPGRKIFTSLGMVEEGLSVLTEAISHYPNIKEISIIDCGIVLPR